VEKICREKMGIPVFHDDQHGTAIVAAAAASNALIVAKKSFSDIKIVALGCRCSRYCLFENDDGYGR
jgi:malate dehydrogenase (oxaloacetate-decarboxylating)(NADP+)